MKSHWKKTAGLLCAAALLAGVLAGCGTKPAPAGQGTTTGSQPTGQTGAAQPAKKSWSKPPEMKIDQNKTYQATVTTSKGTFTIDLFPKDAPMTVNNFVFLSKEGFYNNLTFHRIIKTFMVQAGDPNGNGTGGPGYQFADELKTTHPYEPGIVAMANAGPNTNGSQFFICTGEDSKALNRTPNYTVFGKVSQGMDVVQKIADTPVKSNGGEASTPTEKVTIQSISITEK
ncbi:peptidylprolyl isomerase [Paenibacillus filicis]|uniref:Peptidyl-prolyl cis-trans isomerase n=1 Tax=Paenibacillus gyeongsangnamensis TaxID=3388067 RepID=A0ABT4Q8A0_9BACL|nr:peptidylprolyl isomerase [Paenibacillus filicis]MCZ8513095.1 peptidylprolyl isomerase [Paenibacillus filicis]